MSTCENINCTVDIGNLDTYWRGYINYRDIQINSYDVTLDHIYCSRRCVLDHRKALGIESDLRLDGLVTCETNFDVDDDRHRVIIESY